ncbi:MAG: histidine kinase, partial [Bacteroidota bacterium]
GDHMYLSYGIRNRMNHMLKLSLKPEDRFSVSLNFEFFEGFPLARTGPFPREMFFIKDTTYVLYLAKDTFAVDELAAGHYKFHKFSINTPPNEADKKYLSRFGRMVLYNQYEIYLLKDGEFKQLQAKLHRTFHDEVIIDDDYWVLKSEEGLISIQQEGERTLLETRFQNVNLTYVFEDSEKNIWLCTKDEGLYMMPSSRIRYFNNFTKTLPSEAVYSIHGVGDTVYVGQNNGWITQFIEGKPTRNYQMANFKSVRAMKLLSKDTLVVGLDSKFGFIELKNGRFNSSEYEAPATKKIIFDQNGLLYSATSSGLYFLEPDKLRRISTISKISNLFKIERSYGLAVDDENRLWVGTIKGLYYTKDLSQPRRFPLEGLPSTVNITDLAYADSTLWVTTHQHGLLKIKNRQFIGQYTLKDGLLSNNCTALFDNGDELWVATNRGLNLLHKNSNEIIGIDTKAGLPSNEINAIYVHEDDIWIGTPGGLAIINRQEMSRPLTPPSVQIERIMVNGKPSTDDQIQQLNYRQNNLNFHFLGLAYKAQGKEQYRYRLLGIDTNWTESYSRDVTFHTLPPGSYEFQVEALTTATAKSLRPATVSFEIVEAWWKNSWFIVGLVLALMGISSWIIYRRQLNIRLKEQAENELKQKINRIRVQALQAQMNPHFVFNALNAIQNYLLTNDTEAAIDYLSHFAKMISFIFEYSSKKKVSLERELEFLNHYLKLEKLRFEEKIDIQLSIEPELEERTSEIYLPPLLIQPIVENAFKHGLYHKLDKGHLSIRFENSDKAAFKCTIEDDGIGRQEAAKYKHFQQSDRTTSSMKITLERLNLHHNATPEDYFCVTDLKNDQQQASGTRVEIWI